MEKIKESITGPKKKTALPRKTNPNLRRVRRCGDKSIQVLSSRLENHKWDLRKILKVSQHRPRQINLLIRRDT